MFKERLQKEGPQFLLPLLEAVDFSDTAVLEEVFRLHPGGAYLLARHLEALKRSDAAAVLYELQWQREAEPWKKSAAAAIMQSLIEDEQWAAAEKFGTEMRGVYPEDGRTAGLMLEAIYRQEKDEKLLSFIDEHKALLPDPSLSALYRTVAAYRLDSPGWQAELRRLCTDFEASDVHIRAYLFFRSKDELSLLSEPLQTLFRFKYLTAAAEYGTAWEEAEDVGKRAQIMTPELLRDLYRCGRGSYRNAAAASLLTELAALLQGESALLCREYAGRLLFYAGRPAESARLLAGLADAVSGPALQDRVLWYYLRSLLGVSPDRLIEVLPGYIDAISDWSYFEDLLDELISRLVRDESWELFRSAYLLLEEHLSADAAAPFAVTAAFLLEGGFLSADAFGEVSPDDMFGRALTAESAAYYRIIAAARLGIAEPQALFYEPPPLSQADGTGAGNTVVSGGGDSDVPGSGEPIPSGASSGTSAAAQDSAAEAAELIAALLEFALTEEAYPLCIEYYKALDADLLSAAAIDLSERENTIESLRLFARILRKEGVFLDRKSAEYYYPRKFAAFVDKTARTEDIHPPLLYALIREESHFAASVRSHAGAVGLTQLIPSTAADMADRMGLESYDLKDPQTNISIGGRYLTWLKGLFSKTVHILAAYNAGPGRVRQWQGQFGADTPHYFFAAAIPFPETRNYIRKLFVSTVYYAFLYRSVPLADTYAFFFNPSFLLDETDD
jgi:soluble lytic murein transglycosylase